MSGIITEGDEKLAKTKAIDGMLQELDMSKQDLIDLIKALTEQSVSAEVEGNIEQNTTLKAKNEGASADIITTAQLAQMVAGGNTEVLSKYLSIQELQNLSIKLGLAYSLKRAIELGITLDHDKLASQMGVPAFNKFLANGKLLSNGREKTLSTAQAEKATAEINNSITRTLSGRSNVNDPNSVQNLISKIVSVITVQIQKFGGNAAQMLSSGSAQMISRIRENVANQSLDNQPSQQAAPDIQQESSQQNNAAQEGPKKSDKKKGKIEKPLKDDKKIKKVYNKEMRRGGRREVYATIRTNDGILLEVNLNKMLADNNKLTPQNQALLDKILDKNLKYESGVNQLLSLFPNAKNIQVDNDRLVIQIESKEDLKALKLTDVLDVSKKKEERKQQRREIRREERRVVRRTEKSDIERSAALTRGPELDKQTMLSDSDLKDGLNLINEKRNLDDSLKKDVKPKESKRVEDELIKLDNLHDRQKNMEMMKLSSELSDIKNSVGEVMKDLAEAEKNKDLLKDMKKELSKNKFLDK